MPALNWKLLLASLLLVTFAAFPADQLLASGKEKAQKVKYTFTPPAPANQEWAEADAKSSGCQSCHTASDHKTMHASPAVVLGCTDCHGGDATVMGDNAWGRESLPYQDALMKSHVLPKYPVA